MARRSSRLRGVNEPDLQIFQVRVLPEHTEFAQAAVDAGRGTRPDVYREIVALGVTALRKKMGMAPPVEQLPPAPKKAPKKAKKTGGKGKKAA